MTRTGVEGLVPETNGTGWFICASNVPLAIEGFWDSLYGELSHILPQSALTCRKPTVLSWHAGGRRGGGGGRAGVKVGGVEGNPGPSPLGEMLSYSQRCMATPGHFKIR